MSFQIICGPVFSGKTTELIRQGRRYSSIQWSALLITPQSPSSPSSHAQLSWANSIQANTLRDLDISQYKIILIDDAHFFQSNDDLTAIIQWVQQGKTVWAAGLDADSNGEPYRNFLSWIPKSDSMKKLTAIVKNLTEFEEANVSIPSNESLADNDKVLQLSPKEPFQTSPNTYQHKQFSQYRPARFLGSLTIIFGSMFAGKTTELLRQANRYFHAGANILFINHEWNARYGTVEICTHDGVQASQNSFNSPRVHFIRAGRLDQIPQDSEDPNWSKIDAIFIEEGQFFPDILRVNTWVLRDNKKVFISGLDGDAQQRPFGDLYLLVPLATSVEKHCALCRHCGDGTPAPFTRKFSSPTDSNNPVDVGSADKYEAVCRKHFD